MNNKIAGRNLLVLLIYVAVADLGRGDIIGSAHDFSAQSWSEGQVCLPCHTPHNADATISAAPLWNHEVTNAGFTLYTSLTLQGTVNQPQGVTKLCLSCHDGTVEMDSFGAKAGITFVPGSVLIGTNLSDDHPVSIKWEHQNDFNGNQICSNCHDMHTEPVVDSQLPFPNGYVECSTCHDVHGTTNPSLLRMSNQGSKLCLHCHGK